MKSAIPESPEVILQIADNLVASYCEALWHRRRRRGFIDQIQTLLSNANRVLRVVMVLGRQVAQPLEVRVADDPNSVIEFFCEHHTATEGEQALSAFITALAHDDPDHAIQIFGSVLFAPDHYEMASDFMAMLLSLIVYDPTK